MIDFTKAVSVIGAGRLGASLAIALSERGINIVAASSRRDEQREWLRSKLPHTIITPSPAEAAYHADIVFITSRDDAITRLCEECEWRPGQMVAHCSGVQGLEPLRSAKRSAAFTGAIHPLQTFPSRASSQRFENITFAIESEDDAFEQWLTDLAALLNGRSISISGDQERALYHASAVMACGLLAGLAGIAAEIWENFGVDRSKALSMMSPMIMSTANEIAQRGIPDALTGPYTRGDIDTVRRHLDATKSSSHTLSRAYASIALAQLHIAAEQGNIEPGRLVEISHLLQAHLDTL